MSAEKARGYAKFESRWLRRLVGSPLAAVGMHWAVQSLLYMDVTERRWKLALDAIVTVGVSLALSLALPPPLAWPLGFLIAHTLNFLFNGQVWGVLKHYGLVRHSQAEFAAYVERFRERVEREPSIRRIVICGSLSRQQWTPSSDLDARLLRRPGAANGVRACWFLLRERTRALCARFPVDIYVLDHDAALQKIDA